MQLLFCLVVLLPNALAYIIFIGATPAFLVNLILMLIFFPALTLAFVCLLARMAALIPARGANKSLLAAAAATIFIILYLYVSFNLPNLLNSLVANADSLSFAGRLLFVFDWFAGALTGDYIDALLFILLSVLLLAVVTRLLAAGFLRTALNRNDTARTAKPTRGSYSRRRLGSALFMRELTHLINCAPYMINCALGSVMLLAASVFALIKLDDARRDSRAARDAGDIAASDYSRNHHVHTVDEPTDRAVHFARGQGHRSAESPAAARVRYSRGKAQAALCDYSAAARDRIGGGDGSAAGRI